jgi:hypothetical protein
VFCGGCQSTCILSLGEQIPLQYIYACHSTYPLEFDVSHAHVSVRASSRSHALRPGALLAGPATPPQDLQARPQSRPRQHRPEPRRPPSARSPACAIVGAAPACTPPCARSSPPFGTPPRSSGPAPLHAGRDQCGRGRPRRAPRAGAGQRAHLSTLTQAKALLHAAHGARTDAARCSPRARRVFPRRLARRDC